VIYGSPRRKPWGPTHRRIQPAKRAQEHASQLPQSSDSRCIQHLTTSARRRNTTGASRSTRSSWRCCDGPRTLRREVALGWFYRPLRRLTRILLGPTAHAVGYDLTPRSGALGASRRREPNGGPARERREASKCAAEDASKPPPEASRMPLLLYRLFAFVSRKAIRSRKRYRRRRRPAPRTSMRAPAISIRRGASPRFRCAPLPSVRRG